MSACTVVLYLSFISFVIALCIKASSIEVAPGSWTGLSKVYVSSAKIIGIEAGAEHEEKAQEPFAEFQGEGRSGGAPG